MNGIVCLCHFCELHGPSVLFCTQAFHTNDGPFAGFENAADDSSLGATSGWSFKGKFPRPCSVASTGSGAEGSNSAPATPTGSKSTEICEACRSATVGQPGFISNDTEAGVSYISSYQAHHRKVFSMVRQACVRSLSCEVCPGREGPIFFGDDHNGHVFSHTFFVKDSQARGFQRWYSIIVVMMDKIYLLNSWPFLVSTVRGIIDDVQGKANSVYEAEHAKHPPTRMHHLSSSSNASHVNFRQVRGPIKPARSLLELTDDKLVYRTLHQQFTWILKAGGNRLKEILLEGPPTEDSVIDLEKQLEDTEEGFVLVDDQRPSNSSEPDDMELVEKEEVSKPYSDEEEDQYDGTVPVFTDLRSLLKEIGYNEFHMLAHHVIIGNQVIVRCSQKIIVESVIDVLKTLLPKGCCKVIAWSRTYVDSWRCNFLGLKPGVTVPAHVELYVCMDIVLPDTLPPPGAPPFTDFSIILQSPHRPPEKCPAVLEKIESALLNQQLPDNVLHHCLVAHKEEWMNKVKVRFMFTKAGRAQCSDLEMRKLLPVIGASQEDMPVLQFWMTGLSVQYKRHMLGSAKERNS